MRERFNVACCAVLIIVVVLLCAIPSYAKQELSQKEIKQIEAKIRQDFLQQQSYIESSLLKIGNDLDQFLFGPETTGNLLQFFNEKVKPGKITDQELLWKEFKKDVINKERFNQFVDILIETHFRVFDKARKEVNRDLVRYGLDGVPEMDYDDLRNQLRDAINRIWDTEEKKMREILEKTSSQTSENLKNRKKDTYINTSASLAELFGTIFLPPPWNTIVVVASIAVQSSWSMYNSIVEKRNLDNLMTTAQQQFYKKMTASLESISLKTKKEFHMASDIAMKRLFDAIRDMVVTAYPQIKKENLQ